MTANDASHRVEILGVQSDIAYPMPAEKRDLLHISKE